MDGITGHREAVYELKRQPTVDEETAVDASMTTTAALGISYDRLTADNVVVVLIDHQIGPLWELEFNASRRRVVELATVAERLGIPTIVTAIAPENWGAIIPELRAVLGDGSVIVRRMVNAWEEPRVRRAVESTGRKKLIIAGSVVEVAVAMCALAASGAGYEVYTPIDASGQSSHPAVAGLARAGVIVTTTSLVVNEILSDSTSSMGRMIRGDVTRTEHMSAGEILRRRLRSCRQAACERRYRGELADAEYAALGVMSSSTPTALRSLTPIDSGCR